MKFTPKYAVIYKHERHVAGVEFDIDPKDADEMSLHGDVKRDKAQETAQEEAQEHDEAPTPARHVGRPRKQA